MDSILWDNLLAFDFSGGLKYVFKSHYDLRDKFDDDGVQRLDADSADANTMVDRLGLNYDINARHYSTVVDGDRVTNMVEIEWSFWKVERENILENFTKNHPLTEDQVDIMYDFLNDLRNIEECTDITLGGLMDILVQYYE